MKPYKHLLIENPFSLREKARMRGYQTRLYQNHIPSPLGNCSMRCSTACIPEASRMERGVTVNG
jgi:hypothetical protein